MYNRVGTFFQRLRKSVAGNTLAIAAAALVPLVAMVGGAVDISRYYMATARMQSACDAGALAARKAMGDNTFTTEDRDMGLSFYDQNFPAGTFGLENGQREYTADEEGTVTGTATGQLPTTIMQIFDKDGMDIAVDCSAEINISNTDIMFVLDVTGSMNCPDDGSYCPWGNNGNVEASNAKIKGLRTAVMSFYDAVDGATSDTAQVRYGVVPYSSGVNVGRSIPVEYMASSADYQTRVPQWNTNTEPEFVSMDITSVYNRGADEYWYYWYNSKGENSVKSEAACEAKAAASTLGFTDSYIEDSLDQDSISVISETTVDGIRTRVITGRARFSKAKPVHWWSTSYKPSCFVDLEYYRYDADFQATIVEKVGGTKEFSEWIYKQDSWPVSGMYTDGFVTLPTGAGGTDQTHSWDGCIEEAETTDASSFDPLPEGAYDLDINLIPSTEEQRWKPTLPDAVYYRKSYYGSNNFGGYTTSEVTAPDNNKIKNANGEGDYFCPRAAFRLTDVTRTELENYVSAANGFKAIGSTYHDIGMIWGARFISPRGLFKDDNATAPNGDAIGRHIVFMTDGTLSTSQYVYTPYGVHYWDRRIASSTSDLQARHAARFQAACRQARAENITVWVVAFGTSLSQNLVDCASPGRAFSAADSDELESTFQEIAQKIAALRLTN